MAQKEDENTEIRLGNAVILYERLIPSLKSEINFLKNQILAKDTFTFLRRQLSEALGKKSTLLLISQLVLLQLMLMKVKYAVIAKRQILRKNQTHKQMLTQMQVVI